MIVYDLYVSAITVTVDVRGTTCGVTNSLLSFEDITVWYAVDLHF